MRDLGLPAFDDHVSPSVTLVEELKRVGAGPVSANTKKGDTTVQKFQLGPTLPVVPARLVRCVLRGDYVDMAELTEDSLELELRRSTEGEKGKPTPLSKLKPVVDPLTWARSFCLYTGIIVSAHPGKTRDLLAYLATLLAGAESGGRTIVGSGSKFLLLSRRSLENLTRHSTPGLFLILVLLAVATVEVPLFRQRAGAHHQRRGTRWRHALHGTTGSLVWHLLVASLTYAPSVAVITASLRAFLR